MAKYRKKPVVIEAVQWTGNNISDICKFTDRDVNHLIAGGQLYITTLEGVHRASGGDFIIKGVKGEFYPCKPDIFAQTYEPADDLIANGVTFATDTKVGDKWTPTDERLPDEFVSVLGRMTDAGEFPAVRECYLVGTEFFFPALTEFHPVDKWMEMPKEG